MNAKTFVMAAAAALLLSCTQEADWTGLTAGNHPRLFADDAEFLRMKEKIESGEDPVLVEMHNTAMTLASEHGLCRDELKYKKDASGKRLLAVSREAICRIFSAAYAYRFTADSAYLRHAENDINTVCAFADWNPSHYLDCAEMATAVAIGYDWLYRDLQDSTKARVVEALVQKAFSTTDTGTYVNWKTAANNWNQVCNTGLTIAALATFEEHPQWAREFILNCIESNRKAMEGIYPPEGAYFEGPVYWVYGNMFQTLMLSTLESSLGTDFGLGDVEGFSNTGVFETFLDGNSNQLFNYSDNLAERIPLYPLWYLAWRYDCPGILYRERSFVLNNPYVHIEVERLLPLYIIYASRIDPARVTPPERKTFIAEGVTPIALARTGWNDSDLYLGIKGGTTNRNHGHMDAGEFVFDAYGHRWAADISRQEYVELENPCKQLGGDFWDMSQTSVRWRCFRFGTARHNIMMVNGHDIDVNGYASMTESFETPDKMGATFDLTGLYTPDLKSAARTVAIMDGKYLRVTDKVEAPEGAPAHIRWTLVTESEPEITAEGIILRAGDKVMVLKTEGTHVKYRKWSSDPADYDRETAFFDFPVRQSICGYEYDLPAGCAKEVITTISPESTR